MGMHNPLHPRGIVKRQCLEPLGLAVTPAAQGMDVTRQTLSKLVNERTGVSVETAIRLTEGAYIARFSDASCLPGPILAIVGDGNRNSE